MRNPLIPIILIVLSIATYFAFAAPWWSDIRKLQADMQVAKESIARGNELKELIQNITEKVDAVSPEDQSRLQAVLPFQIDDILFLNDINSLSGNHGLSTKNLTFGDEVGTVVGSVAPAPQPKIDDGDNDTAKGAGSPQTAVSQKTKIVTFSVTAKYPKFITFLRDLEQSLVLYEIKSISFSETATTNAGGSNSKSTSGKTGQSAEPEGDAYSVKLTTYSVE